MNKSTRDVFSHKLCLDSMMINLTQLDGMSQEIKVICLVPSWTETLIEAGICVVGRTRYCIHPSHKVQQIPIVGGTKNLDIDICLQMDADVVLFDREENTLEMVQKCDEAGLKWISTHVTNLQTCATELARLGDFFKNEQLKKWSEEYFEIISRETVSLDRAERLFSELTLDGQCQLSDFRIGLPMYVIWKKPYMVVTKETFIGDVLSYIGVILPSCRAYEHEKYPIIDEENLRKYACLFSSEPYHFEKDFVMLMNSGFKGQLIDGERLSWYGIRNLNYLKSAHFI